MFAQVETVAVLKLKLDLHVHSVYSEDSVNTIDVIVKTLKEQGFQGYAISDHDTLDGVKEALERNSGLVVIPALEVSSKGAHILALEPTEPVKIGLIASETVDIIHNQGATAVLAHPFGFPRSWVKMNQIGEAGFDAIEVANSAQIPYSYIRDLNKDLADKLSLPYTGGSDSHIPETLGRAFTVVESPSTDVNDIIKSIKKGHTEVFGKGITIRERILHKLRKKKVG